MFVDAAKRDDPELAGREVLVSRGSVGDASRS